MRIDCNVDGGWPQPLLTYYEVNKILLLLYETLNTSCKQFIFIQYFSCNKTYYTIVNLSILFHAVFIPVFYNFIGKCIWLSADLQVDFEEKC